MIAGLSALCVNGATITAADIATEAQHHGAPRDQPDVALRQAANALAIRALLLEEAHRRHIEAAPIEIEPGRYETHDEARIRSLLDTVISVPTPAEEDIRTEWEKDPSRFRTPPLWEVSHILCACDLRDEAGRVSARARAKALVERLTEGLVDGRKGDAKDFAALAARTSDCTSRDRGGALGQLGPGDTVPEFEAVLALLDEGGITAEPVPTRYGYHIIRLDAVAEGRVLPYEAVRGKIAEAMEKTAWVAAARRFTQALLAQAEIHETEQASDSMVSNSQSRSGSANMR